MTASILATTAAASDSPRGPFSTMSQNSQSVYGTHSDASDYGDFTLDEQEIINGLLANITPVNTTADEPLELTDIEDYEDPRGVRLPKTLGKELWAPPWVHQQPQTEVAPHITVEDQTPRNVGTTTTGKCTSFTESMMVSALTC